MDPVKAEISPDQTYMSITIDNTRCRFHGFWLRDNALDSHTRSPSNGQRLISLLSQPVESQISAIETIGEETLSIRFVNDDRDYHYPLQWLKNQRYDQDHQKKPGWTSECITLWQQQYQNQLQQTEYSDILSDPKALLAWLEQVERYGFATLDNIPGHPDGLLEVVDLFGYVRQTNYGQSFDVRAEVNPENLAYTGLGLQLHTDNPYRDPAPTMQILACIENDAEGGESIVVDGFQVASILRQENKDHFDLLSQYPARFRFSGSDTVDLQSKKPMIELGVDQELVSVRFNNRSAAPFTDIPFAQMPGFYQAYRHLAEIIDRPELAVSFKLHPGQLFIVDNSRVLHSRNPFSGAGNRWLKGCYPDRDGMYSTLSILRKQTQVP